MSDNHGCDNPGECPRCQVAHLRSLLRASEAEVARLTRELEEWRTSASMACENPASGCDCAGCRFAEQYRAEEAASDLEKEKADG